jgi:hypothetical protein
LSRFPYLLFFSPQPPKSPNILTSQSVAEVEPPTVVGETPQQPLGPRPNQPQGGSPSRLTLNTSQQWKIVRHLQPLIRPIEANV